METFRLVMAGVGGQGTLLASRLISQSAIDSGLPVRIGETYGMAQRGGPVMSHIQIGVESYNPQIRPGKADVLLGFEVGEAVRRGASFLKEGGLALVNTRKLPPVEVISGMMSYPEEEKLTSILRKITDKIITFDATSLAEQAGDAITSNVVMIGALTASGKLPITEEIMYETLKKSIRPNYIELNMKAFKLGKTAIQLIFE